MRKSIGLLLPDLRGGGAERVMIDLATEFVRWGHSVEFILMRERGAFLSEVSSRFLITELGVDRVRDVPPALLRYLCERHIDVLIANLWPLTAVAAVTGMLAKYRVQLVLVEHSTLSVQYRARGPIHLFFLRLSTAIAYRSAHAVVGVSHGVVRDMSRLSGLDAHRFNVVHNPLRRVGDISQETVQRVDSAWEIPHGQRILTVGAIKEAKNHELLIRAIARLSTDQPIRLVIVGTGALEATLRDLVRELKIEDLIVFSGFQTDPSPFYATADLFVLSSDYEGFGNVIVEALSFGLPVVSTDCPSGPAEILNNGEFGRLVPVGDENALAAAISESLKGQHDREKLRARAQDFAPEIAAQQYLTLIDSE